MLVVFIVCNSNFNSPYSNIFSLSESSISYGSCGVPVARKPVALEERVRLPPSVLNFYKKQNQEVEV